MGLAADTIIPEPGNPQALNRYSYVLNNPLKYTDPTGHIETDEEEEALGIIDNLCSTYGICIEVDFGYRISRGKLKLLWKQGSWELGQLKSLEDTMYYATGLYEAYSAGHITSAEFLVKLTDFRSQLGQTDTFVDDISTVVLGERGVRATWAPWLHLTRWRPFDLDDTGFHADFRDGSNQVRHFWFYVEVAYTSSEGIAETGNIFHELQPDGTGSYLDYVLGARGRALGSNLGAGTVDFNETSSWIRRETMEQGMGIMGIFFGGSRNQ